jgi:hypothetical protein
VRRWTNYSEWYEGSDLLLGGAEAYERGKYRKLVLARTLLTIDDDLGDPSLFAPFAGYASALADALPSRFDELDADEVIAWLERALNIEWIDDTVVVDDAQYAECVRLIALHAQAVAERGKDDASWDALIANLDAALPPGPVREDRATRLAAHLSRSMRFMQLRPDNAREVAEQVCAELAERMGFREPAPQGTSQAPARDYSARASFSPGDLLDHPRFGRGEVLSVSDSSFEVRFAEATRKLARVRS